MRMRVFGWLTSYSLADDAVCATQWVASPRISCPPVLLPLVTLAGVWGWVGTKTIYPPPAPHKRRSPTAPIDPKGHSCVFPGSAELSQEASTGVGEQSLQQWQESPAPPPDLQPAASWLEAYLSCPLSHFWGSIGMLWAPGPRNK